MHLTDTVVIGVYGRRRDRYVFEHHTQYSCRGADKGTIKVFFLFRGNSAIHGKSTHSFTLSVDLVSPKASSEFAQPHWFVDSSVSGGG